MERNAKKTKRHARWLFSLLGLASLIAIAVLLISNRDLLNFDAIRRAFSYSGSGGYSEIHIDSDSSGSFASAGNCLALAFDAGVRLYDKDGETILSEAVDFVRPAVKASSKWVAAYDIGGTEMLVFSSSGKRADISSEFPVTQIAFSSGGMAVVSEEAGYKGSVTVYDNDMNAVYKWYSGTGYITGAAISPSCGKMAALTVSLSGSRLILFDFDSEEEQGSYTDTETLMLDLVFLSNNRIAVITEDSVIVFDDKADLIAKYSYSDMELCDYSTGGTGYITLLLSDGSGRGASKLVIIDSDGKEYAALEPGEEVKSLSASGEYISVLFLDKLYIYFKDLDLFAEENVSGAEKVLQRADGTALIIYDYVAELCVP